tara:strand:- start:1186 stop:2013 length:828 start_codon:yes stop_codon:yes gene_type:complete
MVAIKINNFSIENSKQFTLIAGPCQMESEEHALFMAENLKRICEENDVNLIYKSSFDKANRTSAKSKRGLGLEKTLAVFKKVKEKYKLPILTDIHNEEQIERLKNEDAVDILQIPAFLCRQTDLLKKAAESGKIINVKKGQFLSPWDVKNIVEKMQHFGSEKLLLTERGASFGYNNLVADMRSLAVMAETGFPVVFDATHSVQQPGGLGGASGGNREFVKVLARAAIAVGVAAIFAEVHEDPDNAPSDGPCMLELDKLSEILAELKAIDKVVKKY